MRFVILRMFFVIVTLENLKYHQMNINNVFIEFFLKKIIYIILSFDVNVVSERVLCILRSLYDLK